MKKLLPIIFSLFVCIISMIPIAAFADDDPNTWDQERTVTEIWNYINNNMQSGADANAKSEQNRQDMNELKDKVDKMDAEKAIRDYFDEIKEKDTAESIDTKEDKYKVPAGNTQKKVLAGPRAMANVADYLLDSVKGMLMMADPSMKEYVHSAGNGIDKISYGINISEIEKSDKGIGKLVEPIRIFAYSLVLLFFAVTLVEQTIKYEIFTVKGILQIFGRLLLAKIIIDSSVKICRLILSIIGKLTVQMIDEVNVTMDIYPNINLDKSDIKIIGPIIDAIVAFCISLILMLVMGVILVCVSLVMIKLVLRSIELALLMVISPAFFACLSSDITKEYFKRFISIFIQVASQTLFMSIALAVCSGHFNNSKPEISTIGDLAKGMISASPTILILIAMCVMMIKPPKVLTSLVK